MPNYHIEGLSGTGKTEVGNALEKRGKKVVHADSAFGYYGDPETGQPTKNEHPQNWLWKISEAKRELIEKASEEAKFICGGSMNQDEFDNCFLKAFVLYLKDEELRKRLLTRKNNDSGKKPEDLQKILEWNQDGQGPLKYAKKKGAVPIDASQPVNKVVDEILKHIV